MRSSVLTRGYQCIARSVAANTLSIDAFISEYGAPDTVRTYNLCLRRAELRCWYEPVSGRDRRVFLPTGSERKRLREDSKANAGRQRDIKSKFDRIVRTIADGTASKALYVNLMDLAEHKKTLGMPRRRLSSRLWATTGDGDGDGDGADRPNRDHS
jgi:hypothetical protein